MIILAREGEALDQLVWRAFGRTDGITEQVLDMNPGLADLGVRLPADTPIKLPDFAAVAPVTRDIVTLWD